jgi:hypothetical protein
MEERNLSGQFDYVFRTTSAKDDTWQSLDANRSHAQTPSTALSSASRTPISLSGSGSSIRYARSVPHSSRAFLPPKALDGIRQAVHEIRGRVVQQFTNAASISQGVEIPKDLARLWISGMKMTRELIDQLKGLFLIYCRIYSAFTKRPICQSHRHGSDQTASRHH